MPNRSNDCSLLLGRTQTSSSKLGFLAAPEPAPASQASDILRDASEAHFLGFAPTGAGKTRSCVIPNLLHWPGSAVVVDVKNAELYRVTARRRREMGQQVIVVDPFSVTDQPTGGINPLEIFSLPISQLEADAESLAALFSGQGSLLKDPFWDAHGTSLLAAVIAHVATLPPEKRTVSQVFSHLFADDTIYNLAVLLDTCGKTMSRMAYRDIASVLGMPDVTRGGVLATTQSYLKSLHSPGVLKSLDATSFSLADFILGKPMTIYLILPIERLVSHRAVLKLQIGTLLRAIACRSFQAESPTLLLLDECGQLGSFPFLETFITLCRSFSCRVLAFFQDLAQLEAAYPTSYRSLLNNCGLVTFGILNRRLADQWGGIFEAGPAALQSLRPEEQMVLLPGRGEHRTRRLDYLKDPECAGLFDPNPLYRPATADALKPRPQLTYEPNTTVNQPERPRKTPTSSGDGRRM